MTYTSIAAGVVVVAVVLYSLRPNFRASLSTTTKTRTTTTQNANRKTP
jgi:hypothetical protein